MKTEEFTHKFKGHWGFPSSCLVRMYSDDGETYICFINIGDGTSVTNLSEQLASEMVNKFTLNPWNCRFFETYSEYNYESLDEIEYKWVPDMTEWVASDPEWKPCKEEHLKDLFIQTQ